MLINISGADFVRALLKDGTLYRLAIPTIGVSPGAESLRAPWNPYVFHVRAGDRAQLERIVRHMADTRSAPLRNGLRGQ